MVDPDRSGTPVEAIPMEYAALPQYLVDDLAAFVGFAARYDVLSPGIRPVLLREADSNSHALCIPLSLRSHVNASSCRSANHVLNNSPAVRHLVQFFILALNNNRLVVNPYMRGNLVEILAQFTPERFGGQSSRFFQLVQSDPMAIKFLGPGLFQFYIGEGQMTGGQIFCWCWALLLTLRCTSSTDCEATDFYGKLSMRNNAQLILKDLWKV